MQKLQKEFTIKCLSSLNLLSFAAYFRLEKFIVTTNVKKGKWKSHLSYLS